MKNKRVKVKTKGSGVDFALQCETMYQRAMEWRKANPDREVLVQYNYPSGVTVIGTIQDALVCGAIKVNPNGLDLITAMCTPAFEHAPTLNMVRQVLEHERAKFDITTYATPGAEMAHCPKCGNCCESSTSIGPSKRPPMEGDVTICSHCATLLSYTGDGLRLTEEEELGSLDKESRHALETMQKLIRQNPLPLRKKR